jgi:hypothetical protein
MIKIGKSLRCYECEYPGDKDCQTIGTHSHVKECPDENMCYVTIKFGK